MYLLDCRMLLLEIKNMNIMFLDHIVGLNIFKTIKQMH